MLRLNFLPLQQIPPNRAVNESLTLVQLSHPSWPKAEVGGGLSEEQGFSKDIFVCFPLPRVPGCASPVSRAVTQLLQNFKDGFTEAVKDVFCCWTGET